MHVILLERLEGLNIMRVWFRFAKNLSKLRIYRVSVKQGDAKVYDGYDGYNYFYLFNPFHNGVMRGFLNSIKLSRERNGGN